LGERRKAAKTRACERKRRRSVPGADRRGDERESMARIDATTEAAYERREASSEFCRMGGSVDARPTVRARSMVMRDVRVGRVAVAWAAKAMAARERARAVALWRTDRMTASVR
jgi:hypothetical protein